MIAWPVLVEPVNMILSTPSCSDSAVSTSPPPGTTCRTSTGSTWLSTWIRPSTDSGVYSEGLTTAVLQGAPGTGVNGSGLGVLPL